MLAMIGPRKPRESWTLLKAAAVGAMLICTWEAQAGQLTGLSGFLRDKAQLVPLRKRSRRRYSHRRRDYDQMH